MSKYLICGVPKEGFWRCGEFWPYEGKEVCEDALSDDTWQRLEAERNITITLVDGACDDSSDGISHIFAQLGEDDFTKEGNPRVASVEKLLGRDVSKDEVAEAWEAYQASRADGGDE